MLVEVGAFVGVSAVVIMTPGPDTAMTIRNTLLGGRRTGIATAVGVSSGQAIWTIAASAGITALLVASEPAFLAIKLIGAAYLVMLGLHSLYGAIRGRTATDETATDETATDETATDETATDEGGADRPRRPMTAWRGLRQGILSNLGNPKMAVFFMSLLPQFVPAGQAPFAWFVALGLLFCAMTFAWLTGYAYAVAKAGALLRRARVRRALDALMGTVLVGLGVRLATDH